MEEYLVTNVEIADASWDAIRITLQSTTDFDCSMEVIIKQHHLSMLIRFATTITT